MIKFRLENMKGQVLIIEYNNGKLQISNCYPASIINTNELDFEIMDIND